MKWRTISAPQALRARGRALTCKPIGDDHLPAVLERARRRRAIGDRGHVVQFSGDDQRRCMSGYAASGGHDHARPGGSAGATGHATH